MFQYIERVSFLESGEEYFFNIINLCDKIVVQTNSLNLRSRCFNFLFSRHTSLVKFVGCVPCLVSVDLRFLRPDSYGFNQVRLVL